MQLPLPLVSIVVTNHNYGRFLPAAVGSVRAQSYQATECIVVDDASTDDSSAVLAAIQAEWPDLVVIRRDQNGGQGAACRAGFEASRGQYVVFMDADDLLSEDFVATHVYVHLSARSHPGLSSSDIYQVVDGRLVVCTGQALNDHVMRDTAGPAGRYRPVPPAPAGPWTLDRPGPDVLDGLVHVPAGQLGWCWSPGTANMFRRDAVDLFVRSPELAGLTICADTFFCIAIGQRCGGVLIDRPLSVYNLHGENRGTRHAQLANVREMRTGSELSDQIVPSLLEMYTRDAPAMVVRFWSLDTYWTVLEQIDAYLAVGGRRGTLDAAVARNRDALATAVGDAVLSAWMRRRRLQGFKRRWLRRKRR